MPQLTDGKLKTREDVPKVVQGWETQRVWKTSGNCTLQWNDAPENPCQWSAGEAGRVPVRRCLLWLGRVGYHGQVLLPSLHSRGTAVARCLPFCRARLCLTLLAGLLVHKEGQPLFLPPETALSWAGSWSGGRTITVWWHQLRLLLSRAGRGRTFISSLP